MWIDHSWTKDGRKFKKYEFKARMSEVTCKINRIYPRVKKVYSLASED
jgi:hypothetical protein